MGAHRPGERTDMVLTQEATVRPLAPSPWVPRLAGVVTLVNVPVHVAWALGATFLLPGGDAVAALPETRVANAVVSAVLVIGAVVLFLIGGPWSRPEPGAGPLRGGGRVLTAVVLSAIGAGSVVCLSHGLFGLVTKALYLAGLDTVRFPALVRTAADRHTAAVLDVVLFEPWFLLEGVLLALAGRQHLRTARARRRWTATMAGGTLLVLLFGVLLAATGRRVAVG
jgi:hypothetical protein